MDDRRIYAVYLRRLLIAAACVFLLPVAASEFLKVWFSELPPATIVNQQLASTELLYLSGLSQDVAAYKLAMTQIEKPDVIAIGSSRALQVRDFFFNARFVNLGLAVRTVGQLEWVANEIKMLPKKPRLAVVFLDPWWFNGNYHSGKDIYVLRNSHLSNIYRNTYVLAANLFSRKRASSASRLGLAAIRSNQGFDYYGSFHYVARVTGYEKHDVRFKTTLRRIETQDGRFVGADEPNPLAIRRWQHAKRELETAGVRVVEILPPFSSVVVDAMRTNGRFGYVWNLADHLGSDVLDYTDPRRLPAVEDCEFLDGFHGGEVVYAMMLLDAAERKPALRSLLNIERLESWTAANRGMAAPTTISLFGNGAKEVDFLHLGCSKAPLGQHQ